MADRPSQNEEEYFARQGAELLKERREKAASEAEAAARKSHYLKCPKCGADLHTEEYHLVEVDKCPECGGIWFDAGEAEQLIEKHDNPAVSSFFKSMFSGVRSSKAEG